MDIPISEYEQHFKEFQVEHSTALHAHLNGQPYLVGPLARLNLNIDQLLPLVRGNLEWTNFCFPSRNMFHSIIARAVEIHQALLEALQILNEYHLTYLPAPMYRQYKHALVLVLAALKHRVVCFGRNGI